MKRIAFSKDALKTPSRMPANTAKLIRLKVAQYAADPTLQANNTKTLKGSSSLLRLRVGDWRVLFRETGDEIVVVKLSPRGSAYD